MVLDFRRILWVKSVSLDEDVFAYGGKDPSVRAREPRGPGDAFDLHATPEDADSLAEPEVDDLMVLTQHGHATHLVRVTGEAVEPRPRRTIRPGTRDRRFSVQRACTVVFLRDFDDAPAIETAFGFDPQALGGEVFRIPDLPAFEVSGPPMWMVQRRIAKSLEPVRTFVRSGGPEKEGPMRPLDHGAGRVRRRPK